MPGCCEGLLCSASSARRRAALDGPLATYRRRTEREMSRFSARRATYSPPDQPSRAVPLPKPTLSRSSGFSKIPRLSLARCCPLPACVLCLGGTRHARGHPLMHKRLSSGFVPTLPSTEVHARFDGQIDRQIPEEGRKRGPFGDLSYRILASRMVGGRLVGTPWRLMLVLCFVVSSQQQGEDERSPGGHMAEDLAAIVRPCMAPVGSRELGEEALTAVSRRMLRCALMVRPSLPLLSAGRPLREMRNPDAGKVLRLRSTTTSSAWETSRS